MTTTKFFSALLTLVAVVALVAGTRSFTQVAAAEEAASYSRLTNEERGSGGEDIVLRLTDESGGAGGGED